MAKLDRSVSIGLVMKHNDMRYIIYCGHVYYDIKQLKKGALWRAKGKRVKKAKNKERILV